MPCSQGEEEKTALYLLRREDLGRMRSVSEGEGFGSMEERRLGWCREWNWVWIHAAVLGRSLFFCDWICDYSVFRDRQVCQELLFYCPCQLG